MADFSKITYYDLKLEALSGRLEAIVGREEEMSRMSRILNKSLHNNCLVIGQSGIGKTSLLRGWIKNTVTDSGKKTLPLVELKSESFESLNSSPAPLQKYKEALEALPPSVVFIDDFGRLIYNKPLALNNLTQLLRPLAESGKIKLVLALELTEFNWLKNQQANFLNYFEEINLSELPKQQQLEILSLLGKKLSQKWKVEIKQNILDLILQLAERFIGLGRLPASGIAILDELLSLAKTKSSPSITEEDVYKIVSDKIGVPLTQLKASDKQLLSALESELNSKIIGQAQPLLQITSTIKRARLGLKNPGRPLGSFLCLGPSGVGKTETAKLVAEKIFGKKDSFIRIDMSEFGEAHTVARLIGAPAGYVGFDTGGGLTNAVKQQPYSLILLDEIEKAHPKIFDVFLQILDDGRLTSAQGETVDFTQTIIMATSNLGVPEIIEAFSQGQDIHSEQFQRDNLVPALAAAFRLEFLNRFDALLVFNPLTELNLLEIAKLEIKKVEARVERHKIKFKIDPAVLIEKIKNLNDPRFGARPIKRYVETTCENLISQKLLA